MTSRTIAIWGVVILVAGSWVASKYWFTSTPAPVKTIVKARPAVKVPVVKTAVDKPLAKPAALPNSSISQFAVHCKVTVTGKEDGKFSFKIGEYGCKSPRFELDELKSYPWKVFLSGNARLILETDTDLYMATGTVEIPKPGKQVKQHILFNAHPPTQEELHLVRQKRQTVLPGGRV